MLTIRSEWFGHFQSSIFPLSALSFVSQATQKDAASIGARKETNRLLGNKNRKEKIFLTESTEVTEQPETRNPKLATFNSQPSTRNLSKTQTLSHPQPKAHSEK
ncbi:MAG TPA: hypothetical protein DDY18_01180 [Flavobacterium sp.]|nr:hypothetical protein [Flavobacterium sp.]